MSDRNWFEIVGEGVSSVEAYRVGGAPEPIDVDAIAQATGAWRRSKKWETGWGNFSEKLMLVVTEIGEASEAAEAARKCWRGFIEGRRSDTRVLVQLFHAAVNNYVEEWVDVMVRLFDLIQACDLAPPLRWRESLRALFKPFAFEGSEAPLDMAISGGFLTFQNEAIRSLTAAMEVFRDVKLGSTPENGVAPFVGQGDSIEILAGHLFDVLDVCAQAIAALGEYWPTIYAEKMEHNEKRPTKHGRQR